MIGRFLSHLKRDAGGAAAVEFAILAPIFFAMVFGVLQVGIEMWSYNSLRSVAADTARYTMVEYQKQNEINEDQVESKAVAIAVNPPYEFNINAFDPVVATPATDIPGMKKFTMSLSYTPMSVLGFIGVPAPALSIDRPIYVPE